MSGLSSRGSDLDGLFSVLAASAIHHAHDDLVRLAVRLRAHDACEYCLLPTTGQFHIDHIIPPSSWHGGAAGGRRVEPPVAHRGGPEHVDNFAWCCPFCNGSKGRRIAHRAGATEFRLYDPRRDRWAEHFVFLHGFLVIGGVTGIGQATALALGFNSGGLEGPLGPRHEAILAGRYPPSWARGWDAPT